MLVGYDNISSKFDFQSSGLKVKVTVAIFRKIVRGDLYRLQFLVCVCVCVCCCCCCLFGGDGVRGLKHEQDQ